MKIIKSVHSYHNFEGTVRRKNRFFYDTEIEDFLQTILETSKSRLETIPKDAVLWRSQLGHDWEPQYEEDVYMGDWPCPFRIARMKPMAYAAYEGRANPKGIPYLYLSTDKNTSMAEVRPWIGSYISLGQFKLLKDVTLVNCTSDAKKHMIYFEEPADPNEREIAVWGEIDGAFSKPVTPDESVADYIPTQILAEFFKKNGFDGIAYRSSLGKGHNIALFDLNAADLIAPYMKRKKFYLILNNLQ